MRKVRKKTKKMIQKEYFLIETQNNRNSINDIMNISKTGLTIDTV